MFGLEKKLNSTRRQLYPEPPEDENVRKQKVAKKVAEDKTTRHANFEEGVKRGEAHFARPTEGLDAEKRKALQYEASRNIDRNLENADRKLLGEQSRRGILGKGGVGYAQRRDLQNMGLEANNTVDRDLTKLDRDLALKKQAATFGTGMEEASQGIFAEQAAVDELKQAEQERRNRKREFQFDQMWNTL